MLPALGDETASNLPSFLKQKKELKQFYLQKLDYN